VIDEFHPSVGSHPSMMEGFVMCSLKKRLSIKLGFFGTIAITTIFLSLLKRVVTQP
jgi:hypothetical protein